jgi:hypothetical protein
MSSPKRAGRWPNDPAGRVLCFGIIPAWGLPGLADWMCHRRSRIEIPERGGFRESLLHVLMLTEGAIPLGLTLFAEPTPLMVSALAASAVVHQTTANWDLRVADDSDRRVSPLEQQIHSALEAIPFVVCLLGALRMTGTGDRSWKIRRTSQPLPGAYLAAVLLATAATGVLPHVEELWRCLRRADAEDSDGDAGIARRVERPDTDAIGALLPIEDQGTAPGGLQPRK